MYCRLFDACGLVAHVAPRQLAPPDLCSPQPPLLSPHWQKFDTFVSGVSSQRGTLPWTAPEILRTPDKVTEKVGGWAGGGAAASESICLCAAQHGLHPAVGALPGWQLARL